MGGYRMTHPIVAAAREFQSDELRRRKRKQKPRLSTEEMFFLTGSLETIEKTQTPEQVESDRLRVARGHQAVEIFGYRDTFDEQAATVITDILHAAAARGWTPQAVLDRAARYYAEERPH
jgi:hypothetical protein